MNRHVYFIAVTMLLPALSWSQQVTGNLQGRVYDGQGQPLPTCNISVTGENIQGVRGSTSNKAGWFRVLSLPVGLAKVKITHIAHHEIQYDNVPIRLGKTTTLGEIHLAQRTIEMSEVIVTSTKPVIDPNSTAYGDNLEVEVYSTLPVERNYRSITALLAHTNTSFLGDETNFAGSTGLENKYFIDGVNATDPFRGMTGTNLPYNFVKEVEVKTGGYEAEYRSSLGGLVNVVTHGGGNELETRVFGFFANNRFSGDPRQGVTEPVTGDFSQFDFGFGIGGAIVRDKLWFFAAYNPTFEREDVQIPGVGFFEDRTTSHIFAGKLTWQPTENTNLIFTIFGDPSDRRGVGEWFGSVGTIGSFENPDPFLGDIERGGINVSLKTTHLLNKNILLDAFISHSTRKEKNVAATDQGRSEPFFLDATTGIASGGYPLNPDDLSIFTEVGFTATMMLNNHIVKAGLAFQNNRLDVNNRGLTIKKFGESFFQIWKSSRHGTLHHRCPSLFVQDSWLVHPRLRLNFGLRWDGQYLIDSDGNVAQEILDQYQPRVGFIFQPGELGSQKIIGSFGRFYQELATWFSHINHNGGVQVFRINYSQDPRMDTSGADTVVARSSTILPKIEDLEGNHFDEFTLGYERQFGAFLKLGIRGIYRTLRRTIEGGRHPETRENLVGNPGYGRMTVFPKVRREYKAFELSLATSRAGPFNFLTSYVLSRTEGNYSGLFNSDFAWWAPNASGSFSELETLVDADGLLPNDRTHVLKFSGSYKFDFGFTVGTIFSWSSGTPLNEFGGSKIGPPFYTFLQPRGTVGRTSSIWDWNLRFVYDVGRLAGTKWNQRLILDILHIGSLSDPVDFDQVHFFNVDENGNQINANPLYKLPTRYQPPMSVRLGFEIGF